MCVCVSRIDVLGDLQDDDSRIVSNRSQMIIMMMMMMMIETQMNLKFLINLVSVEHENMFSFFSFYND